MRSSARSAAVLLILSDEFYSRADISSSSGKGIVKHGKKNNSLQILLTKRTNNMRHHAGEVAFPGGMREECDKNLFDTALREAKEEIALNRDDVKLVAQLPPSRTRQGINVHPYIVRAEQALDYLEPDKQEIASLKWVDVDVLCEDRRIHTDVFDISGQEYWAPVYEIDDYYIWGVTARLLVHCLNHSMGANICRKHEAPEKLYKPTV